MSRRSRPTQDRTAAEARPRAEDRLTTLEMEVAALRAEVAELRALFD